MRTLLPVRQWLLSLPRFNKKAADEFPSGSLANIRLSSAHFACCPKSLANAREMPQIAWTLVREILDHEKFKAQKAGEFNP